MYKPCEKRVKTVFLLATAYTVSTRYTVKTVWKPCPTVFVYWVKNRRLCVKLVHGFLHTFVPGSLKPCNTVAINRVTRFDHVFFCVLLGHHKACLQPCYTVSPCIFCVLLGHYKACSQPCYTVWPCSFWVLFLAATSIFTIVLHGLTACFGVLF